MLQNLPAKKILGQHGEDAVAADLEKRGYTICARNYSIVRGEIDIIAHKENTMAFVEVKTRQRQYFPLSEVIVPTKQRKIIFAARHYIFKHRCEEMNYRFDVALVYQNESSALVPTWDITYIKDAFTDTETLL